LGAEFGYLNIISGEGRETWPGGKSTTPVKCGTLMESLCRVHSTRDSGIEDQMHWEQDPIGPYAEHAWHAFFELDNYSPCSREIGLVLSCWVHNILRNFLGRRGSLGV
jgi:hypothetical protein